MWFAVLSMFTTEIYKWATVSTDELFYTGKDGRLLLELMVAKEKTFRFLRSMYLTMLQAKTVKVCIYF